MKPCILLIEDDQDMRDLVSGHLEHSGFDVQRADDGIKGQALALQYTPDLILLDLMLPKVDGLTLCQRLRRDDRTAGIPILMLTALGGTKDKVSGFNSGADDYLTKPFDLEELQVRVKACCVAVTELLLGPPTTTRSSATGLSPWCPSALKRSGLINPCGSRTWSSNCSIACCSVTVRPWPPR